MSYALVIDFEGDWVASLREELLIHLGYDATPNLNNHDLAIRYFNVAKRRIPIRPRRVLRSSELTCSTELQSALDGLLAKATSGDDLTPHLSKALIDADYNDYLLNDWGIHHFHLGTAPDAALPAFVARTGPLLFARVTDGNFYALAVLPHGSWTEQRLVTILYSNWPESIEPYRLKGVTGLAHRPPTSQELKGLRRANVVTVVEVAVGAVYAPIGGGYTTSGVSSEVVRTVNRELKLIRRLEAHVRANLATFLERIRETGAEPGDPPVFRLLVNEEGAYAVETGSGVAILLHKE